MATRLIFTAMAADAEQRRYLQRAGTPDVDLQDAQKKSASTIAAYVGAITLGLCSSRAPRSCSTSPWRSLLSCRSGPSLKRWPKAGKRNAKESSVAPFLSTSGETLTIEESMTLRARTENAGHAGDEHERSWSSSSG